MCKILARKYGRVNFLTNIKSGLFLRILLLTVILKHPVASNLLMYYIQLPHGCHGHHGRHGHGGHGDPL